MPARDADNTVLEKIRDRLSRTQFNGQLGGIQIRWMRRYKRPQTPRKRMILGICYTKDNLITIHRVLAQNWVPIRVLEYVILHEMIHMVIPPEKDSQGRLNWHPEAFMAREAQWKHTQWALDWEQKNLERLYRR